MEAVLRPLAIYFCLLIIFRITGKRSLGEITSFDLVVLLIISEAVSQSLLASDGSMTAGLIAAITLLLVDVVFSLLMLRFPRLARLAEDEPVVLLSGGKVHQERLRGERVCVSEILEAAREHGLERLDQIKLAILERRGTISIIPAEGKGS
jgi:uncharacterized membrane protein YcaP (DUF421 family)